jgi:hypothetical protein
MNGNYKFLSHTELIDGGVFECDDVIVFSYSINYKENLNLAVKISKIKCTNIIYISSYSVYSFGGWMPRYPKVKMYSELVFQLICNARVVRLGVFDECEKLMNVGIKVPITTIEDIYLLLTSSVDKTPLNYFRFEDRGEAGVVMKFYVLIYNLFGGNLFLLRAFDYLFKIFGHKIYGYTYKSIMKGNYD